jgi:hypothetical protein
VKRARGKKIARGGGGPYRAYLSVKATGLKRSSGNRWDLQRLEAATREYRRIKAEGGDEWDELCRLGSLASDTHRVTGGPSFGKKGSAKDRAHAAKRVFVSGGVETLDDATEQDLALLALEDRLQESMRAVLSEARQKTADAQAASVERQHAIAEWSDKEVASDTWRSLRSIALEPVPAPDLQVAKLRVPAIETASVLGRGAHPVVKTLRQQWRAQHELVRESTLERRPDKPYSFGTCWKNGRCACTRGGKQTVKFASGFRNTLKGLLAKGKPFHGPFVEAEIVVKMESSTLASRWVHCSYSNMVSWDISLMSVIEEEDDMLQRVAEASGLQVLAVDFSSRTLGIEGLIDFCATLDIS